MNLLLPVLLVFPLVGALVMYPLRGTPDVAKKVAIGTALLQIVLAAVTWFAYSVPAAEAGTRFQLEFVLEWIPAFGTQFALGIDGIALVMIALTAFLVPGLMLFSWEERLPEGRTASGYFALLLATEATLMGVFTATDVFLFYVFFEAMLIPMYFLIGRFGGPRRQYAAVKFFLYSLFGGLIMLASLIGLYVASAQYLPAGGTFNWATLRTIVPLIPESTQIWLFLGFFIAFAIKAPLVPLHTWLPDAAEESSPGGATMMVGVMDKIGTFGMIRFCLPLFPEASLWATPVVIVLAVISILYGAMLAIGSRDIMRFVAYTSISHFGFIVLGIFAFTTQSLVGSTLYMLNHGLSTAALFIAAGYLIKRGRSRSITDYSGVQKAAPVLAGLMLFAGLSTLSLPGLSSFVSEFMVLAGTFSRFPAYAAVSTLAIVLAALYILIMYQRTMTGPLGPSVQQIRDVTRRERVAMAPLVLLILVLGVFPKPMLDVIEPTVVASMADIGVSDPPPRVSAEGGR